MPISMNSPSASIVATPAGADCSSSASCSTRSLRHPLDIGLHALALKHKTTTCSGHCTQAATPLTTIALARVAAHVVTVEIESAHQVQAKHNLAMAGLADRVMFMLADIMDDKTWNRLPPVDAA